MISINKTLDAKDRLSILAHDGRFDLACACGTSRDEHRSRSDDNKWIYPVALAQGRTAYLFKTLLSNSCVNNCKYCPLRTGQDFNRCRLTPEELCRIFLSYYNSGRVSGIFLSSAVSDNPDSTMERINRSAQILRRSNFKGYIHLKIIPGASEGAIRQSLSLASAVSLNIETAGADNFRHLSTSKDYLRDIIRPMEFISSLRQKGSVFNRVHQTTQFVVGASEETDKQIIGHSWKLYKQMNLNRVYFSAYQRQAQQPDLPGEQSAMTNGQLLTREHRLYQVDLLIRKYGFAADEISYAPDGNLPLEADPKENWARFHPEFFPVNINRDDRCKLLRVPGLGQVAVGCILELRKQGFKIKSLERIVRSFKLLKKASQYVTF